LAFGSSALANAANASAAISVTCGSGTPYSVTLDNGQHSVSGQREMTTTSNGGGNVVYNLYSDSNRTIPWAAAGVGGTGNGSAQTITVYGQVPAAGGATVGSYSDSVGVTVNY
jgi:spore coat protein U-like protein